MKRSVAIKPPYITLGQFLKFEGIVDEGFLAKPFLAENVVLVNGERDTRRGRKLYPGDQVEVDGTTYEIVL
jgi:ribosome-associated protein YbcJ (S4-like RNA binding protein)